MCQPEAEAEAEARQKLRPVREGQVRKNCLLTKREAEAAATRREGAFLLTKRGKLCPYSECVKKAH